MLAAWTVEINLDPTAVQLPNGFQPRERLVDRYFGGAFAAWIDCTSEIT